MRTKDPNVDGAAPARRTAIRVAAMTLALYVVMHLGVAGIIRLATGRDASVAIAPGGATASASAAPATPEGPSAASGLAGLQESALRPRDCRPSFVIDSDCIFD
ncbi:MAG TPA: hypothetical protein VFF44_01915 [Casimicrobiaceae bacterium]|nr:hypothetical protein [Casimicrobiaceae bacterium]